MSHIKDYEKGCVTLPQELKDFIYNLVSNMTLLNIILGAIPIIIILALKSEE